MIAACTERAVARPTERCLVPLNTSVELVHVQHVVLPFAGVVPGPSPGHLSSNGVGLLWAHVVRQRNVHRFHLDTGHRDGASLSLSWRARLYVLRGSTSGGGGTNAGIAL